MADQTFYSVIKSGKRQDMNIVQAANYQRVPYPGKDEIVASLPIIALVSV